MRPAAPPTAPPGLGGGGGGVSGLEVPPPPSPAAAVVAIAAGADRVAESMWHMNLGPDESFEPSQYPERPGEPDCSYYMRTGLCRFGTTCKFNHPPDRMLAVTTARLKGEYPQRAGQPECQYYLKTGTCKFGATCKFDHPRDRAGIATRVHLNFFGYPLRPGEKECAYYLRTGQCKFGITCKFDHPPPSNQMVALRSSSAYPTTQSATSPAQQSYSGSLSSWPLSRTASFIANARWQGPSSYAPLVIPQGLVQVPGWSYSTQIGSSSAEDQHLTSATNRFYTSSHQSDSAGLRDQPMLSSYHPSSVGVYAVQRENIFPERPGQPECQFYMKTGDCKFGAVCKFHHPRVRLIPAPDCALSAMGLPLRPEEPVCSFYSRYGTCKFGPNCKFNHPMRAFMYPYASSPTADAPAMNWLMGSSSGFSRGLPDDSSNGRPRRLSLPEPLQIPTHGGNAERQVS